ncbi:glucan 1,3-beta-glucosidase [Magnaporthiopsis poae ATCC 64411]|uniref:Glucan 1,3-beta-glucosidase n=1 Tax=Magnaporthiopsis poae (strain ATCC 64411 / 73-15) TaxID=644358 RepID=A0A0C4DS59_MAGP6|nr:glucan 1,3-beta-glucosidase [Magnaporthiopsis poae ATCC 64411]
MRIAPSAAFAALVALASAENYLGFNSGSTKTDRSAKFKSDFVAEFTTAQNLDKAPGKFNAVRLYTNIQAYSQDDPIEAFEAAIDTKTKILLGVWASGTDNINKELSALKKAVTKYGSKFTDLVIGISIGSEDLYRNSVTGVTNKAGVGAQPDTIVGFINDFKKAFKDSPLGKTPVGHVDTWDVWPNATNKAVLDAIDWVGVDEYPYYENGKGNNIKNSGQLFDRAYLATVAAANGKPVWVTETGWPASGPDWDEAVPSVENAKYFWDEVGCRQLFGKTPTFWYNLRDSNPDNKQSFAITKDLSTKPLFDLSCPTTFQTPAQNANNGTASTGGSTNGTATTSGVAKPTGSGNSGSGSSGGSGSGSGSNPGSGGSGSGSGSNGGSGTNGGSGSAATGTPRPGSPASGASSVQGLTVAMYGGLALVGGVFALL